MDVAPPGPLGAILLLIMMLLASCVPQGPAGPVGETPAPVVVAAPGQSATP